MHLSYFFIPYKHSNDPTPLDSDDACVYKSFRSVNFIYFIYIIIYPFYFIICTGVFYML